MEIELRKKTISGLIWSTIQHSGAMIISFIANLILARLLSVDDFGIVGLISIFIIISNTLIDGGFGMALVQKKEISQEDYSTVFYWNMFLSVLLYLILFLSSPIIASFYKEPLLIKVLRIQGLVIVFNALSLVQFSHLRRTLQFSPMAKVTILSTLSSVIIGISLAVCGFGIWSLVVQNLSYSVICWVILSWHSRWWPKWSFSIVSFKRMFSYGGYMLSSSLLDKVADNIQGLIIGRISQSQMGYYSQARKLEEIPTNTIKGVVAQVSFSVFSKIQDNKSELKSATRRYLIDMNYLNIPLMLLLIIVAGPLIHFLYSDKWMNAVPYFQVLCCAGLVNCLQSVNYQVVCAVGRSKEAFYWNILKRAVGILLILIGSIWGIYGILWGVVAGRFVLYFVNAGLSYSTTGYSIWQQLKDVFPTTLVSIICAIITFVFGILVHLNPTVLLFLETLIFVVLYIIISFLTKNEAFYDYLSILKSFKSSVSADD